MEQRIIFPPINDLNGPTFMQSKNKLVNQEPNFVRYIKPKCLLHGLKFTEYFRNATIVYSKGRLNTVISEKGCSLFRKMYHQWQPHSQYLSHNYKPPVYQSEVVHVAFSVTSRIGMNIVTSVSCTTYFYCSHSKHLYINIHSTLLQNILILFFLYFKDCTLYLFFIQQKYFVESTILLSIFCSYQLFFVIFSLFPNLLLG